MYHRYSAFHKSGATECMDLHAATMECFKIVLLSCTMLWPALGSDITQGEVAEFTTFSCQGTALCATSEPSINISVRSKGQCTFECQHRPESCVSVNYRSVGKSCEMYSANPTNFMGNVAGCQYLQVRKLE